MLKSYEHRESGTGYVDERRSNWCTKCVWGEIVPRALLPRCTSTRVAGQEPHDVMRF